MATDVSIDIKHLRDADAAERYERFRKAAEPFSIRQSNLSSWQATEVHRRNSIAAPEANSFAISRSG
jgi:hypothetical protein